MYCRFYSNAPKKLYDVDFLMSSHLLVWQMAPNPTGPSASEVKTEKKANNFSDKYVLVGQQLDEVKHKFT